MAHKRSSMRRNRARTSAPPRAALSGRHSPQRLGIPGRFLGQDIEESPATGLQCRPDESREKRIGRRNPGLPEHPPQRSNPGDVAGVGPTVIEPIVDRGAGDPQDAGEPGLVDRERRLQFPYLDRDGESRDFSGDHVLVECLDDVIVQFAGPGHNPLRVRIKSALDVVIHVDQGEQHFTRRFDEADVIELQEGFNAVRAQLWTGRGRDLLAPVAYIDVDGTLAPTLGTKKEGMDMSYKGVWGYHPLIASLANTGEVLYLVNRPGNVATHSGAAEWIGRAVGLVAPHAERVCVRTGTRTSR